MLIRHVLHKNRTSFIATVVNLTVQPEKMVASKHATDSDLPAGHLAESRLPALDGIRGMAVLMILVFHFWQSLYQFPAAVSSAAVSSAAASSAAASFQSHLRFLAVGQTGVDLFFVLSGFLITGILLNAKGTAHFLRNFYVRRALRILPLYYLLVCGYFVAGWIHSGFSQAFSYTWWYFPYLQNVGMTFWPEKVGEPGHFWSLGVEEHFYLLWPFLVLVCRERRLPLVLLGIILGSACFRLALIPLVGADRIFWFSFCRMDALALGALLAVLVRRPELGRQVYEACRWGLLILGPALLVLYPLTSGKHFFFMQTVKYLLVAVAYTMLLGMTVGPGRWGWLDHFFRMNFLRWCGKYSYAMYVFHPVLFLQITRFLRPRVLLARTHTDIYLTGEFILMLAVVFLVSWASWHLYEKHFLKLKHFFEYSVEHH
jgi:peptidoglycan/LPS O-acetylase OafA/YrhL